jgi:SpoVK/Ycf46/Vps4 family AAA+-type ATPase
MRKAIRVAESVAPCILWLDELEKGFSGTQSSGMSDGGTTSRVFGTFLTWMQDKKAPAFVVATSNDVTSLPPELLRKGRFDEIFFIDLPTGDEREQIFKIHLQKRKRNPEEFDLAKLAAATPGFSGAEIEACVVEALYDAFDDDKTLTTEALVSAAHHTVPLSMTMRERIEDLREWANTRARIASSAHSEDMATIAQQLMVAKATDPETDIVDPSAIDISSVMPSPAPRYSSDN